jgi:hypothetical protein
VHEETGLADVEVGPCVWRHRARFSFAGMRFDQLEHIHVARFTGSTGSAADAEYQPAGLELLEALAFGGMRWFSTADLQVLAASGAKIIPPWLPEQLPGFLQTGAPAEPIDLGELGPVF